MAVSCWVREGAREDEECRSRHVKVLYNTKKMIASELDPDAESG
jgi:hypothetical protein